MARISQKDYAQLYNIVSAQLDDEAFGLFDQPLRCGSFEFLTRGTLGSPSLGGALDLISRFLRLGLPDIEVSITRAGEHARLQFRETRRIWPSPDDPRRVFAHEWLLRLIHALLCWLADRNISLDRVEFPYAMPAHAADYALIYTAHSQFDMPTLVAEFDQSWLGAPVRRDASDLAKFLDGAPGRISMLYRRDREIIRQVKDVIATRLADCMSLQEVASVLHISTRSLQRKLAQENSSLRQLKDIVRKDWAFAKLERTEETISQIAEELGYSDATAFYRAFHNWTDQSPKEFRAAARK